MAFNGHKNIHHFDGSTSDSWHPFFCAHCNREVSGACVSYKDGVRWLQCPNCGDGSVLTLDGKIYPGVPFGPRIEGLPDDVLGAYNEARNCMSVNAYTSCELICRKILMHVAVEKGAEEGTSFADYISYLQGKGYVTETMKEWVDLIREHGNRATHEIETPEKGRAESTLMFTAELLRLIYEMEYMAKRYAPQAE